MLTSMNTGNNVCPGRHFAQMEIQSVVGLFIAGFDVSMLEGGRQYVAPPFEAMQMIAGVRLSLIHI